MRSRSRNKGSILALVSIIVLVLSITGLSMLELAKAVRLRSVKLSAEMEAQSAADTGIDLGVEYVYNLWNANAPELIDIDYTSSVTSLPGSNSNASYQFSVSLCDDYPGYEIVSTSSAGVMDKEIHFRMLIQHPWVGIAAKDSIAINVGTGIGLQPPDYSDFTLVTNQIYSNAVTLRNGVYIPGDVIVGPGGDPEVVIDTKRDAVITGETWSMLDEILYPDVTIPSMGYASLGTDEDDGAMVMDTDGLYGSITVGTNEKLKVVGDVTAIIDGDLIVKNSGYFMITAGSSLHLYMLGDIEMKYGSIFMNEDFAAADTYEEIRDATKSLKIYGGVNCRSVIFKNSSFIAGAVYAPYAYIDFRNSADYYGAVLGHDVSIKNSGNFIFVFGLYDDMDRFVSNLKTQRGSWWEN